MNDKPFFSDYLQRLETVHEQLTQSIQDLPQAALDWIPAPDMNSLAVLLAHTTGALRFWIGDVALGEPSGRVRAREFETRGLDAAELLHRLDDVLAFTRLNLPRLSLSDLDEMRSPGAGEQPVSCAWALLHALDHSYLHLGHVQLTRQLWENQAA